MEITTNDRRDEFLGCLDRGEYIHAFDLLKKAGLVSITDAGDWRRENKPIRDWLMEKAGLAMAIPSNGGEA